MNKNFQFSFYHICSTTYLLFIAMIIMIRLITNKNIMTIMNGDEIQNFATIPQTINNQIIDTTKNKFQLSRSDCLVERVL